MAVITKPSKAIDPSKFGINWAYTAGGDSIKIASNGRTFPQPDHYKADPYKYGYKVYIDQFIINKSASGSIAYRSSVSINNGEVFKYWQSNAGYQTGWLGDTDTDMYLNTKKEAAHQDNISYVKNYDAVIKMWSTSATTLANQRVVAAHFRNDPDTAESDESYEIMPVLTSSSFSWAPYQENEAASSYIGVVGSKNVNRINNQTTGAQTIMFWNKGNVPE